MPSRSAAAVTEMEEAQPTPGLQFNEALSWRAGKAIAVADLLKRLNALSKEMQSLEQEENERDSFTRVAKELVNPNLLAHKDKGVKALTAACLVDILRLCAPDAPYTGQQLRDIFNMIIGQIIPALADPSNAYNNQHIYVLSSLAQVKSIVLLADIPSADTLIKNVFQHCFDVVSASPRSLPAEEVQKNVEANMTALLVCLVDESQTLPPEVVDIIVAQFLRTDPKAAIGSGSKNKKNGVVDEKQSTLFLRQLPSAYNMARYICNACPEKMARYFSQYFNDVVVDASNSSAPKNTSKNKKRHSDGLEDSDDENSGGPTEQALGDLRKVHGLLRELWRACPGVLQNVIPQLEAELAAENIQLRLLATETLGDIISGIGAAGLPAASTMDPAAYPSNALMNPSENTVSLNLLTKPSSPQPFPSAHPQAYANYLGRRHDRTALIRAAWTTGVGRILSTSAGGAGLSQQEEDRLISDLNGMLGDADEKVRVAAVKVVANFTFRDIVGKLGRLGGVSDSGSLLATLADRVRDRKHLVREEAMAVLARIWGVAVGELSEQNEQIVALLGGIPSKILDTYYTNDIEIMVLLDRVFYEYLLPLSYPPVKARSSKLTNGNSQGTKESQGSTDKVGEAIDPDKIRTERILLLVKALDERAKKVFYAIQSRQLMLSKYMGAYLARCEDYNGGVMDENESSIKENLARLIKTFAGMLPNPPQATSDLWKFAKLHDRRSYQLIRFCMAPESDYRTVYNAIKEFTKRVVDASSSSTASNNLLDTLTPLLYRVSLIVYNKSHVPAIMEYSRTDDKSLAATAHEVLREISSRTPEVLKAHVQEICKTLQDEAPSANKPNAAGGAVDNLKACASFASKYPKEIPKDRKFVQAMSNFAVYGSPPEAAKYAVSVIWAATERKESLARDLAQKCIKGFTFGGEGYLSRLATLSQLMLLAPAEMDEQSTDEILDIAIAQTLLQVREPSKEPADEYAWSSTVDGEGQAKCWALKILVNRIRSHPDAETFAHVAAPVYNVLSSLVSQHGELSKAGNTPPTHKSRLRLLAARLYLKLCTQKAHDALLTPSAFNALTTVAQDPEEAVRSGFLQRLKKYLNQQKLPQRFYTIPFLLAFEPSDALRLDTTTWIRSRATAFANAKSTGSSTKPNIVMESVFARLLSVLSHHPDYASEAEDLIDFSRYIIFYLQNVATADNVSLIYHIAQRVKQCRDAVTAPPTPDAPPTEADDRLYHLSDLAQVTIRKYEETHNWTIQTLPAKVRLPSSIFSEIKSHAEAQHIAEHHYLPDGVEAGVEDVLKATLRASRAAHHGKKRKAEGGGGSGDANGRDAKKAKAGLPIRKPARPKEKKAAAAASKAPKTPKPKKRNESKEPGSGSAERRRSGRVKEVEKSYVERDSDEDDEEMEMMDVAINSDGADEEDEEMSGSEPGSTHDVNKEARTEEEKEDEEEEEEMEEADEFAHEEAEEQQEEAPEAEAEAEAVDEGNEEEKESTPKPPPTTPNYSASSASRGSSKKKKSTTTSSHSKTKPSPPPRTKTTRATRSRAIAV
ncbi:MAG: hypothetical protein L6R35_002206 [Caloplaca aegaea]|nr:MAG: hypothetical protein L6R35_002206 [Caloplaca aegaea]